MTHLFFLIQYHVCSTVGNTFPQLREAQASSEHDENTTRLLEWYNKIMETADEWGDEYEAPGWDDDYSYPE